jgi:hypothetical protein
MGNFLKYIIANNLMQRLTRHQNALSDDQVTKQQRRPFKGYIILEYLELVYSILS